VLGFLSWVKLCQVGLSWIKLGLVKGGSIGPQTAGKGRRAQPQDLESAEAFETGQRQAVKGSFDCEA
jgi:hypothetical protein